MLPSSSSSYSYSYIWLALCIIVLVFSGSTDASAGGFNIISDVGDQQAGGGRSPIEQKKFPALIAFGDSILDTGNNNLLLTYTRCNFPPYGRDFPGKEATGRFGNGRVFSDLIAEALGIKSQVPAFRNPFLTQEELATGVCFASGGSGLDPLTSRIQNVISIMDQFSDFKKYISKLEGAVGAEKAKTIVSESLYLVSSGNNDIGITYSFLRWFLVGPNVYSTRIVGKSSTFVKEMHALGARNFAIMSTLPLGCLPSSRTLTGGLLRVCSIFTNSAAKIFNSKLEAEMNKLNSALSGVKIVFLDVYNPLQDIIRNPYKHGFLRARVGCCGTGMLEMGPFCNIFNLFTCLDASKRVFWDAAHPSERAYQIVVSQVIGKLRTAFNMSA